MKRSLCCLILAFIAACGKEPKTLPNQVVGQENFTSMSSEEILRVKYDNEIDLKCDLRVHEGPYVDLNYKPSKSFTWKLNRELSQGRKLEVEFKGRRYTVDIRLSSKMKVQNLEYTDSQGNHFTMLYSPTVNIRYRSLMSMIESMRLYEEEEFIGEARLFENIPVVIYSLTSENLATGETVSEDLRCQLKTQINPAYKDQWIQR
jgi:hypothetical protein